MADSYGALDRIETTELERGALKNLHSGISARPDDGQESSGTYVCGVLPIIAVLFMAASTIMLAYSRNATKNYIEGFGTDVNQDGVSPTLSILAISNEYGMQNATAMLPYTFLVDSFLVEPYKESVITLTGQKTGCSYGWSFANTGDTDFYLGGVSLDGKVTVTLNSVGHYIFTVAESCTDTPDYEEQLTTSIWVKYVRRELSSLTDDDREAFLDAFHTLWTLSTTDGMALYGDRFKSVNYFATLHNDGGGNAACDEFHGGLGFLNNHIYLSAYLEQSLQLVNPAVALHYMEYSKYFESLEFHEHLSNQLDGGSWTEILTSKFFGSSDPITGRIVDGRWENATTPYLTTEYFVAEGIDANHTFFPDEEEEWLDNTPAHLSSPYGLLRSPWNYNPSPLVTRYGTVFGISNYSSIGLNKDLVFKMHMGVVCDDYTNFFGRVNGKSFETYLLAIENDTHGIFHFTFGGVGGKMARAAVKVLMDSFGFTYSNIATLATAAQPFFKKYLALSHSDPVNCTANPWQGDELVTTGSPGDIGGPQCDFADHYYDSEDSLNDLIDAFFDIDLDSDDSVVTRLKSMQFQDKADALRVIGGAFPFDGDLAGSGAALDPLFWVAHGAMERIFQKAIFSGMFSDTEYTTAGHCSGHNANKAKLWLEGFYFTDETVQAEKLTNAELTRILNPTTNEYRDMINFVYDTASFEWCADAGTWFVVAS